jgi:sigma-B regulation protein RsbU (phosphoserine phosphatase)
VWSSISKAIAALTAGEKAEPYYDIAAERIQSALLTVQVPTVAGLELGVRAEPARLVGGDYIDVFRSGDHLLFGLGDASGKSLGAAINALMLRYLVRGLTQALGHEPLETIIGHTNQVVAEDLNETDYFITLLLGTISSTTGELRVVNAGHEPALLLRAQAREVEVLTRHGLVLGVDKQTPYAVEECTLDIGDRAVIYTDGLTEATNTQGELYTLECLRENFLAHRELNSQELADALFDAVKAFSNGQMRDDATLLVIRRTGLA